MGMAMVIKSRIKCKVENCKNTALALGLCNGHYLRHRKGIYLNSLIKERRIICSLCDNKHYGNGFCKKHYFKNLRKERWEFFISQRGSRCFDCHQSFPYQVYDFHHLDPTKKDISIGNEMTNFALEKLEEEVKKCVLLCSNCHRIRHATQQ